MKTLASRERPATRKYGARQLASALSLWATLILACTPALPPEAPGSASRNTPRGADDSSAPEACAAEPPQTTVRLLHPEEYWNTLRELFPDTALPPGSAGVFSQNDRRSGLSPLTAAQYLDVAQSYARAATPPGEQACKKDGPSECYLEALLTWGERALRRPLSQPERRRYAALFEQQASRGGVDQAQRDVVAAFLVAPAFLYRLDLARPARAELAGQRVDDYALASRLSYLLWRSMPDAELFEAARKKSLGHPQELRRQVERLLRDARASSAFANFVTRWFDLHRVTEPRAPDAGWTAQTGVAALQESERFSRKLFESGRATVRHLLLSNDAEVNDVLAPYYGLPLAKETQAPTATPWRNVQLDPQQRAGLLTRVAFLAGHSRALASPPLRGHALLTQLLCGHVPPPSFDVTTAIPDKDPSGETTNRERFERSVRLQRCRGCHEHMDSLGYALENYDGAGRYQTQEGGRAINARVQLSHSALKGSVNGALELSHVLASSPEVERCAVDQLYRDSLDYEAKRLPCSQSKLYEAIRDAGGDLRAGLAALATSREVTHHATTR